MGKYFIAAIDGCYIDKKKRSVEKRRGHKNERQGDKEGDKRRRQGDKEGDTKKRAGLCRLVM